MTTVDVKEFLQKWEEVHSVIEIHHLNKVNAGHSVHFLEEITVRHFRNVLKMRQKRPSSDSHKGASAEKCPKKDTEKVNEGQLTIEEVNEGQTSELQPGPSRKQILRKENINEGTLAAVLLEDDNSELSSLPT